MKRKAKKNNNFNKNQRSFYFEDYLEANEMYKKKIILEYQKIESIFYFFYFFH